MKNREKEEMNNKYQREVKWTILIGLCAVFLYLCIMTAGQSITVMHQFRKEMTEDLKSLIQDYDKAEMRHNYIVQSFDSIYYQDLQFVSNALEERFISESGHDLEWHIKNQSEELYKELFAFYSYFKFNDIVIVDQKGQVLTVAGLHREDFTEAKYAPLLAVTDTMQPASLRNLTEETVCLSGADSDTDVSADFEYTQISNYYAVPLAGNYALIISVPAWEETCLEEQSDVWTVLLQNEIIGERGYVFVWSDKTEKILYYPEKSFKYEAVDKLGLDMDALQDGECGWNTVNGREMYLCPIHDEEHGVWVAGAVSRDEMISSKRFATFIQWIAFVLLASALVYYVILLLGENRNKASGDPDVTIVHHSRKHRLIVITIMISAALMLFSFYIQTLYLMSSWAKSSGVQISKIQKTVEINEDQAKEFISLYAKQKEEQTAACCEHISKKERNEDESLQDILNSYYDVLGNSNLQILNKNGKEIAGVTYFAHSLEDSNVKEDVSGNYVQLESEQDNGRDLFDWMSDGRRLILPVTGLDNEINKYLYVYYYSKPVDRVLNSYSLKATMDMVRPGKNGLVFCVNQDDHIFSYFSDPDMIGANALEYGLKENQIKDNTCDYIQFDNRTYYATSDRMKDDIVFFAVARKDMLAHRFLFSLTAVVTAFILFILIGLIIYTSEEPVPVTGNADAVRRSKRDGRETAEHKIMRVLKIDLAVTATAFTLYSYLHSADNTDTVIGYVLEGNWERGANVFALTASLIILCRSGLLLLIANKLAGAVAKILPVRNGTILKMVTSLCTYIAVAFILYQCMLCFGLDPTALMASTGVIAVILGIGANSLVGDIIAGVFLLMEGNVQIGDVVKIGDFRGYVTEMGIRMTKLYDMDTDDVKIIPNKEVRDVVHMTMMEAAVYNEYLIRYEEKIEDVERILVEELSHVENKSPLILDGPRYIGVSRLDDSGVMLRTKTRCHEASRAQVSREVNHIVYSIFQKNNIEIPYPHVRICNGDESMIIREFPDDEG